MRQLLYALLALSLAACGEKPKATPANLLASNDFESVDGWLGGVNPTSLTKDKAHSGRYSVKVSPESEYSLGYDNPFGKLSASKLKKIKLRAWVNLPNGKSEAILVAAVPNSTAGAKPLLWEGVKLRDKVKSYNKWVEVEKEITLPDNITYNDKINAYLWSAGSSDPVYMDDMSIEKVE